MTRLVWLLRYPLYGLAFSVTGTAAVLWEAYNRLDKDWRERARHDFINQIKKQGH